MRDYVVISDSTADLPIAVVKELEVPIVPFSYSIEEQVYEYYLDERDGDIGSFYERLRKGAMPVTSQINPAMYQDFLCDAALLKAKSPSCGAGKIYDGTFTRTLIDADGATAELLKKNGVAVFT